MRLREMTERFSALRFMADDLALRSGAARRVLMDTAWMRTAQQIEAEYKVLSQYVASAADEGKARVRGTLDLRLARVRDIQGTLQRLAGGGVPDDVEWFEVKLFALTACEIRGLLPQCGLHEPGLPDLTPLVALLDPEGTRIASFHVYDAYSEALAALRRQFRTADEEQRPALMLQMGDEEERIRTQLAAKARPMAAAALEALDAVARIDIRMSRAVQVLRRGLCIPQIAEGTAYKGLFHPAVAERLADAGRAFQPVDFGFGAAPTLVTGSNMGGKSVLLHMVALAQCLCQYGFGVPARQASVAPVDGVALCLAEPDAMKRGLSAFAAEIVNIQAVIAQLREGSDILAVIDEPAQTTNPAEGAALVAGLLEVLDGLNARAVVTTHYGGIAGNFRRMRVKGFTGVGPEVGLTPANVGDYMDYGLVEEADGTQAPREALRVADMLGVDGGWIAAARRLLPQGNSQPQSPRAQDVISPPKISPQPKEGESGL